ncbi:MAG: prepilin-type N-terminal cleavage/methylation domain-containing protein [Planctomycetota bacterium]|nr:prepilin-type N-terminal cleavage/methylation domain-containing protein [Planctomycetota bacterium]
MSRQHTRAFTLIELLVVITIVAILIVLLVPSLTTAYQTAHLTRCRRNLNTMYSAYSVWRADRASHGLDTRLKDMAWRGQLVRYMEEDRSVFICESRWRPDYTSGLNAQNLGSGQVVDPEQDWTTQDADALKARTEKAVGAIEGMGPGDMLFAAPDPDDWAFEFDIYLQQGAIEGNTGVNGAGISGPYGEFVRSVSLGNPLVRTTKYKDHTRFESDDCAIGITGDADIAADIYFKDGRPSRVSVIRASGAGTQSAMWRYIYDFKVAGQVVVQRWQTHYGETIDVMKVKAPGEVWAGGARNQGDELQGEVFISPLMGDYGLSRGSYEASNGRPVLTPDGKQFFILDYPRPLADFTLDNIGDKNDWEAYFVEDPAKWNSDKWPATKSKPEMPWKYWQALRHFGKANVLFCDGHVELVSGTDKNAMEEEIAKGLFLGNIGVWNETLRKTEGFSPLWNYAGR